MVVFLVDVYKKYVENSEDKEVDAFYRETKFQPVLGGENYRKVKIPIHK